MIVIFKNGQRLWISEEWAKIIFKKILGDEGAKKWQISTDAMNNRVSGFNLDDVSVICYEEDII